MRVFAYGQMSENAYGLPGSRQFIVAREGNKHFIPDSADIDSGLRRQGADEFAVEKRDHGFVTKGEALKRGPLFVILIPQSRRRISDYFWRPVYRKLIVRDVSRPSHKATAWQALRPIRHRRNPPWW